MHQAMSSHSIGRMSIYRVSDALDVHDNGIICGLAWYLLAAELSHDLHYKQRAIEHDQLMYALRLQALLSGFEWTGKIH